MLRKLLGGTRASFGSMILMGAMSLIMIVVLAAPALAMPREVKACHAQSYSLNISWNNGGTVTWRPHGPFRAGTRVKLWARPDAGFVFDHWEGDITGTSNPATIVMDSEKTVIAYFVSTTVYYSLNLSWTTGGTVTWNPDATFEAGTEVTLTATPDEGFVFDRWEGDVMGTSNQVTIIMDSDKYVWAYFVSTTELRGG